MWNEPSAEVTQMKRQCEQMLEDSEEDIEDWYYNHQGPFGFSCTFSQI